jgi:hypothetical protein
MSADRFMSIQVCDDIRMEVGNKYSLIGCYAGGIHVTPVPSALPKLCFSVKVYTPITRPFAKLVVRVLRGETSVAEMPFPPEGLAEPVANAPEGARHRLLVANIVLSPFPVEGPCSLRVEADTEDGTLYGGTVQIEAGPAPGLSAVPAPARSAPT